MPKTSANIRRALVQAVRAAPAYGSLKGIFRGFAPEETEYPFATYNQVAAPYEDDWSNRMMIAAFDVFVFSRNEVEAGDLDQALADALDGAALTVENMTTLICHRISDIPVPPDPDDEGKKVYQVGGTYEIWTDQPRTP
jgi:hypothetical protein